MEENKQTILVVDDTETNIDILVELLGDKYDVMVALDGHSAIEIGLEEQIDLILLDIMMPEMDGFETCEIFKSNQQTKDIPIIFITANSDEESIEKAYDIGGIDYVTKPFKPKELLARVKTQLELRVLITHLEYISSYDSMTGIYNRRKFFELATEQFDKNNENIYAVMMDIDRFKNINDTYGHPLGDQVIKLVTKTISDNISNESILGRLGGEEFAILCCYDTKVDIVEKLEKIRKEIESLEVIASNGDVVKFTISTGVTKCDGTLKDIDELLKEADVALYDAKGTGRNKSIFRIRD